MGLGRYSDKTFSIRHFVAAPCQEGQVAGGLLISELFVLHNIGPPSHTGSTSAILHLGCS